MDRALMKHLGLRLVGYAGHLGLGYKAAAAILLSHQLTPHHVRQGLCVLSSYLLLFLASLTFTQADYIIDDSNSTVAYTLTDMW
jgi:hypothetical protein